MRAVGVIFLFALLTVGMTYPQVRHLSTQVPPADDPLLSIWRLSWVAHTLPSHPIDLLNGNIFYPERRTLAFTDATLLEGFVAAPLIWSGLSPVTAYNVLLLACIALSGAGMWLYAYRLTGSPHAALVAGIVFAFVPFRFDHLPHLELQATMFIPLTMWWIERALDSGDRRDMFGAVASFVAQVYTSIYYAVFLGTALLFVIPLRRGDIPLEKRRAWVAPAIRASVVAALVILPYLSAYVMNRGTLGERDDRDVHLYSATIENYLATPSDNLLHGSWSAAFGQSERRLFPGVLALGLAAIGLAGFEKRRGTLVIVGLTGFIISLGLNTPIYDWLRIVLFPYRGLRAPARASILVFFALAGLAAFGWARILPRLGRWRTPATAVVAVAMLMEYATLLHTWLDLPAKPPAVYAWLATQPRSVVVEFPLPTADRLDFTYESLYMFGSTTHWQPILNGYSGFFPQSFLDLTEYSKSFPDDRSVAYLKQRGVDFIVVHGSYIPIDKFGQMTSGLLARPDVQTAARFEERLGPDIVFRLSR
jgi:hypothetical protein